jgi:predicted SAM-dependent methyltransferase
MLKRFTKALLRPFTRRLFWRVDTHISAAAVPLEARLSSLERDVAALKDYVPVLLNTISSQNAAARDYARTRTHLEERIIELGNQLGERLAQVEERGEFIRRETMFEMRYGRREGIGSFDTEPRLMAPEKLAKEGALRINLGSGHIPLDGFLNVDGRPLPGIDVVADVRRLPFDAGEVDEIYSAHLLEHFPIEELTRSLLPYWFSLLRPGGRFVAVVPDAETMAREFAAGRYSFDDLRLVTFGEQEYDGDFHFTMFSHDSLVDLLRRVGFDEVRMAETGRRNGACYEMEVVACKPGPESAIR